jgi:hypothetical protein
MVIVKILDFLFHKIYIAYKKKEKSIAVSIFATVTFLTVTFTTIMFFVYETLNLSFNIEISVKYKEIITFGVLAIEISMCFWLYRRYSKRGKIQELNETFRDKKYAKIKSWHVFMLPVFFVILTFAIIFLFSEHLRFPAFEK